MILLGYSSSVEQCIIYKSLRVTEKILLLINGMNSKEKYFSFIVNICLNFRSFVKSHHAFNNRKNNLFQLNCKLNTQEKKACLF